METTLVEHGLNLMLYGMGTVFAFLTILVIGTTFMSRVVTRFFPDAVPIEHSFRPATQAQTAAVDPKILAVIQEGIYQHRAKTK